MTLQDFVPRLLALLVCRSQMRFPRAGLCPASLPSETRLGFIEKRRRESMELSLRIEEMCRSSYGGCRHITRQNRKNLEQVASYLCQRVTARDDVE